MEQLRQLIEAIITEGALEQEVTLVSRRIIDVLKLKLSKNAGYVRSFKFKLDAPDTVEAKSIRVSVKRGEAQDEPIVTGAFEGDPQDLDRNIVEITIEVPSGWSNFDYAIRQISTLLPELKAVLRHEFEHSTETAEEYSYHSYRMDDLEDLIRYFLDPAEVAAYVSGMYKNAKVKRVDLMDVFNEWQLTVLDHVKRAGANEAEAQKIAQKVLDAWIAYAQKRFPSARL